MKGKTNICDYPAWAWRSCNVSHDGIRIFCAFWNKSRSPKLRAFHIIVSPENRHNRITRHQI